LFAVLPRSWYASLHICLPHSRSNDHLMPSSRSYRQRSSLPKILEAKSRRRKPKRDGPTPLIQDHHADPLFSPQSALPLPLTQRVIQLPPTAFLDFYGFKLCIIGRGAFHVCCSTFLNDVGYLAATLAFALGFGRESARSKTNVFFFDGLNPWPGVFWGRVSHVLHLAFLFQYFNGQ
jgi:hypothetical protein